MIPETKRLRLSACKKQTRNMQKSQTLVLYIHGNNGSAEEAKHYVPLFPGCRVVGFDYRAQTPWDAISEYSDYFDAIADEYSVILIANSIGAYYSLCSLAHKRIEKAYFISPVADMEKLICDMMKWADVSEEELREKKEIPTAFGETLSFAYLKWVREHPVSWTIPTEILYGGNDHLQSRETIERFAKECHAHLTVMEDGEHWFHTEEQMHFLDDWLLSRL